MANFLLIVVILLKSFSFSLQEVCVVPDGGSSKSCKTVTSLNHFCKEDTRGLPDHTLVTLLSGTHHLNTICQFSNVGNITLRSETGSNVTIQCNGNENAGFLFSNVSNLVVSSFEMRHCAVAWDGASKTLTFWPNNDFTASLLVIEGRDHILRNLSIVSSGGVFIHNAGGTVTMNSIEVTRSQNFGIIIWYDMHLIGNNRMTIADSLIAFQSGLFMTLGRSNMSIDIVHTNFYENHLQSYGGNMGIFILDASVSVMISDCNFNSGKAEVGGGLYIYHNSSSNSSSLSIVNSTFANNIAEYSGGGVGVETYRSAALHMDIINSSFYVNTAAAGSALYVKSRSVRYFHSPTSSVHLKISVCNFSNNKVIANFEESGTILLKLVPSVKMDNIVVKSNNNRAIVAVQSNVEFSGSSQISNNTGYSGGGLYLKSSRLFLKPNTNLVISNNSAETTGGGIQVSGNNYYCFYGFSSENMSLAQNINFTIINNSAQICGDNYYESNIKVDFGECLADILFKHYINIPDNAANNPSSISSDPQQVCLGGHDRYWCGTSLEKYGYPGGKLVLTNVYMTGESFGLTTGVVSTTAIGHGSILKSEKTQLIGIAGGNLTYTIYRTSTDNRENMCKLQFKPDAFHHSGIHFIFMDCPLGFQLTSTKSELLECQAVSIPVITDSNIQSQTITKRNLSWLGIFEMDNQSYVAASNYCPLDYCNPTIHEIRSHSDHLDQDEQCQYNRTGVLCGACPEGWSMVLGSSECRKCSSVWLLLILPFALAGLLLVVLIHFLDLTVTSGTVCGLIFYANILQDHSIALLSKYHPIPGLTPFLQVFLSWVNLDLGISACFYNSMEAFGKTMLLFVFPVYIWFISAVIIILSNRFFCFTRLMGSNAMKVLSTLIILSYSKMLRVTIDIFSFKLLTVYNATDSSISSIMARWTVDGNIPFLDSQKHLVLFLIAVLFVLLLLPFTITLLCIKHVYYLSNCGRVFSWVDKLKPFFETYTGPFKDNARFWTGLLLFVRLLLLIVSAIDYSNDIIPYIIIAITCLLLLVIMVILQGAYKNNIPSALETFFIFNICAVFLINAHETGSELWTSIISHLLVTSAFFVFLGIIAYHVCLKFGFNKCLKPKNVEADYEELDYEGMRDRDMYRPLQASANY